MITITVFGIPGPQGSKSYKGLTKEGRPILAESSKKVKPWREAVKWAAIEAGVKTIHGPVRLSMWRLDALREVPAVVRFLSIEPLLEDLGEIDLTGIHWVIVGGESGPGARPMHPEWARSVRDQCVAAGVPFFFKQWGEWIPVSQHDFRGFNPGVKSQAMEDALFAHVGKKAAGRLLDGREWNGMPPLCSDCPPIGYPTDKTRCEECPRREANHA